MIKLRRRNPVTEIARVGSFAGSKLTRTRGSRKERFVGRLYRRFTQAVCGFVDLTAIGRWRKVEGLDLGCDCR
jgi:hypothetical protein